MNLSSPQFTEEIDKHILELYQTGISGHKISKQLGIDSNKVYVVIRESGLIRPPRKGNTIITAEIVDKVLKLYESGLSTSKVAKEVGIGKTTVINIVNKSGISRDVNEAKKKGTPEERQKAVELYLSGLSADEVPIKFNVGSDLILKWVRESGGEVRTYLKGNIAESRWK